MVRVYNSVNRPVGVARPMAAGAPHRAHGNYVGARNDILRRNAEVVGRSDELVANRIGLTPRHGPNRIQPVADIRFNGNEQTRPERALGTVSRFSGAVADRAYNPYHHTRYPYPDHRRFRHGAYDARIASNPFFPYPYGYPYTYPHPFLKALYPYPGVGYYPYPGTGYFPYLPTTYYRGFPAYPYRYSYPSATPNAYLYPSPLLYPPTSPECAPYVNCQGYANPNDCRSCVASEGGGSRCASLLCGPHVN